MIDLKTYDNIAKYLSGNMTPEEQQQFNGWLEKDPEHRNLLKKMTQIWSLDIMEEDHCFDKKTAWENISGNLSENSGKNPVKRLNPGGWKQLLKIAAVFILCAGVSIWVFTQKEIVPEILLVESGEETITHPLPDGTTISLNKNSKISYDINFEKRWVSLEGEAFFEVETDQQRPFIIHSGDTRTQVLGTAFNLRAYPDEAQVELLVEHGKVAFYPTEKEHKNDGVILTKGESGLFEKESGVFSERRDTTQNAFAWKTGKLNFDERPAHEIVKALERYYQIKFQFEFPENSNCPGTVSFDHDPLKDALETLEFTLRTTIKKQHNHYLISGKACIEKMKE